MGSSIPAHLPGMEPENIKNLLTSFFLDIDNAYPDKIIVWSEWNHERWDKAAGYLCKTLGYSRGADFLEAYGYSIVQNRTEKTTFDRPDYPIMDGPPKATYERPSTINMEIPQKPSYTGRIADSKKEEPNTEDPLAYRTALTSERNGMSHNPKGRIIGLLL